MELYLKDNNKMKLKRHHISIPCKTKAANIQTEEFWEFVTCKKCLRHKPDDDELVAENLAIVRQNCDYQDERNSIYNYALHLISKGHKYAAKIAHAVLTGKILRD